MSNGSRSLNLFFSKNNFKGSFNSFNEVPNGNLPECCFIGRSNVGKSSIINAITKSKKLAKTSKTPGRTQNINLFVIHDKINIIDLPGYGYAKVSKMKREELSNLIESYLINRENLKEIFVLIDCRVGIKDSDIDILDFICENNKQFSIILTKVDKCAVNFINKQKESLISLLKNYKTHFKTIFSSSSNKNIGIVDIQKEIFSLTKIS
tara:strand:- start:91 stop:714 length:624 start_codon:yes stop_codon:yes gene_type:complete